MKLSLIVTAERLLTIAVAISLLVLFAMRYAR